VFDITLKYNISRKTFEDRLIVLESLKRNLINNKMEDVKIINNEKVEFKNSFGNLPNNWHIMASINKGKFEFININHRYYLLYIFPIPTFVYISIGISIFSYLLFHNLLPLVFFLLLGFFGLVSVIFGQKKYFRRILFG